MSASVPIAESKTLGYSDVDILQLSASADDYFIPGIHISTDIESMQSKNGAVIPQIISNDQAFNNQDINFSISSTFDSSVGSNQQFLSDTESDSTSEQSFSILADLGITDDFIGMKEDHFSTDVSLCNLSYLQAFLCRKINSSSL